ncbi:Integrator complex subunit 2 [Borealophlyctis nickersoniae]|nr:Integrator complex subunit 2 [Borealophlyctis nickersoniae]
MPSFFVQEDFRDRADVVPLQFRRMELPRSCTAQTDSGASWKSVSVERILECVKESPGPVLNYLAALPPEVLLDNYETVISTLLADALDGKPGKVVLSSFAHLWQTIHAVVPRELWLKTANEFRGARLPRRDYQQHDLIMNPLLLFRSHPRVFSEPVLFGIFLQILENYLVVCRNSLFRGFKSNTAKFQESGFGEVNVHAMLDLQESAAIQMLLETCLLHLPKEQPGDTVEKIRAMTCSFIHHIFVEKGNSTLVKLVHFQGYPRELLPVTVDGIPSMYVCFDFIHELMAHADPERQVFGIYLAGHLSIKYPLERSLTITKDVVLPKFKKEFAILSEINKAFRTADSTELAQILSPLKAPSPPVARMSVEIIPALVLFVTAFATDLAQEIQEFLQEIKPPPDMKTQDTYGMKAELIAWIAKVEDAVTETIKRIAQIKQNS